MLGTIPGHEWSGPPCPRLGGGPTSRSTKFGSGPTSRFHFQIAIIYWCRRRCMEDSVLWCAYGGNGSLNWRAVSIEHRGSLAPPLLLISKVWSCVGTSGRSLTKVQRCRCCWQMGAQFRTTCESTSLQLSKKKEERPIEPLFQLQSVGWWQLSPLVCILSSSSSIHHLQRGTPSADVTQSLPLWGNSETYGVLFHSQPNEQLV